MKYVLLEKELQEKLSNQEIQKKISIIDSQIDLLKKEIERQSKEILEEEMQIDEDRDLIINNIQKENSEIDLSSIFNYQTAEEFQRALEKSNQQILEYQLQLNKIEYEEKNISEKLEQEISLKEEYENLEEQLQILKEKEKCFQATKELLEKAYDKMKESVTPKFTQNLSKLIEKITNGKYKKVTIQEDGLVVELQNGQYIPANLLSIGTIDQLYLSLRLSMIDEISTEKIPIILDEVFAYFDDERLKNSLLFLISEAKDYQIILLTCTKREKQILDELGISYNWVEM